MSIDSSLNVKELTDYELVKVMNSNDREHAEEKLFFGDEKGWALRYLKRVHSVNTDKVKLLVFLIRMCRRTEEEGELRSRASYMGLELSKYLNTNDPSSVRKSRFFNLTYEDIIGPSYENVAIPHPSSSGTKTIKSQHNTVNPTFDASVENISSPTLTEPHQPSVNSTDFERVPDGQATNAEEDEDYYVWIKSHDNYCRDRRKLQNILNNMATETTQRARAAALKIFLHDPNLNAISTDCKESAVQRIVLEHNVRLKRSRSCRGGKGGKREKEKQRNLLTKNRIRCNSNKKREVS